MVVTTYALVEKVVTVDAENYARAQDSIQMQGNPTLSKGDWKIKKLRTPVHKKRSIRELKFYPLSIVDIDVKEPGDVS